MSGNAVEAIADAVLYEGYMLYPYRPSSTKNRQRWTFGGLYPESYCEQYGDSSGMSAEVLVTGEDPRIDAQVRFLHLIQREDGLQEGMPRSVAAGHFDFARWQRIEEGIVRRQEALSGLMELSAEALAPGLHKVTVRVMNLTALDRSETLNRDDALLRAMVSTHVIVRAEGGDFVSLMDPPDEYREAAASCRNVGVWPVLAGVEGSHDCMLASPIILYDYPQIAPESAGDLFDGTEIDEILTLRIMTMTDAEKDEMRGVDDRTRRLLERTEALSAEQLMRLHGTLRNPRAMGRGR
jgi:hypothetical protein